MIWKPFGTKQLKSNRNINPVFAWTDGGKPRKTSVKIGGVSTEVQTEHLVKTSLDSYRYNPTGWEIVIFTQVQ
jgi:hypothetical protein